MKIRAHEGEVRIGAKTVMGQECTISAYQHVSIGRECIIADRVMLIDFDHGVVEVDRPIRLQGIYKRDVASATTSGSATAPRSCAASPSATTRIVGTNAVVTQGRARQRRRRRRARRVLRMRDAPETLRWS